MRTLPESFKKNISHHFPSEGKTLLDAIEKGQPVHSVLINRSKYCYDDGTADIAWNTDGRLLESRPEFILDPLYHAGCYYSQEASSMIIGHLAEKWIKSESTVLDLCAAPGGKTLNILNRTKNAVVIANEVDAKRNSILRENLAKWGRSNTIVTQNRPEDFTRLKAYFDLVLVDAPCSGEGMFRKDPFAIQQWSRDLVVQCAQNQRAILESIFPSIKQGGRLIYSTCTLNAIENEDNSEFICDHGFKAIELNFPDEWNIKKARKGHYFLPGSAIGEGLYFACFEKSADEQANPLKRHDIPWQSVTIQINNEERNLDGWKHKNKYVFMNEQTHGVLSELRNILNIKNAGTSIGVENKGLIRPEPGLALSSELDIGAAGIELSEDEAIRFLYGHALSYGEKGWHTVNHRGAGLGIVKGTGTRLNNHHPKNWRIKKQF